MGSRVRENPEQIFELFVEIGRLSEGDQEPFVLQQYPDDYSDADVLKSVAKFAFPCANESVAVDHFTFVLTDIEGKFKFGFCRHATGALTCLCLISYLPWYEIFYKLLNNLADILNNSDNNRISLLLEALHQYEVPPPGSEVIAVTPDFTEKFIFTAPNPSLLPEIPQNRNLTEYYSAVSSTNMVVMFASMFFERRVLITSRKLSRLTACIHGAASLLYPMHWQHLYIPVLPQHLIDYCSAPMPYLIGIHTSLYQKVRKSELGDAVILDADTDTVTTEFDDVASMPSDVVSALKKRLKSQQVDRMMGDGLARTFLQAMVVLLGSYRDALRFRPGEQITFDSDAFVMSRSPGMRPFLEKLLHLQTFQQFIAERLDLLNSGQGFADEFEIETNSWADKWGTQSRYKDWLVNMKKQSKKGKDKWREFTSRANPAVKLAVQSVKDRSKKAYHGIKSKMDENKKEEIGENSIMRDRPSTVTAGNAANRTRPSRPAPLSTEMIQRHTLSRISVHDRARLYRVMTEFDGDDRPSSSVTPGRASRRLSSRDDTDLQYQRISLELMHDPDIVNMMRKSYSLEDVGQLPDHAEEEEEESPSDDSDAGSVTDATYSVTDVTYLSVTNPPPSTLSNSAPDIRRVKSIECSVGHTADTTDQPLIQLNSTSDVSQTSGYGALNVIPGKSMTLPRNSTLPGKQTLWSVNDDSKPDGFGVFDGRKCVPIPECTLTTAGAGHGSNNRAGPVPRPRTSLRRSTAFHGDRQVPSIVHKSSSATSLWATDSQSVKDARSAFMQSDATKHSLRSLDDLEQFDPLLTGQLAIDASSHSSLGSCGGAPGDGGPKQEENLLREWNLDFSKMAATSNGGTKPSPVIALKPPTPHHLVNTTPTGWVPPVQQRALCSTLPAQFRGNSQLSCMAPSHTFSPRPTADHVTLSSQFKGHTQSSYMPPRQTCPPHTRADPITLVTPVKGRKQPQSVQSLISTFEKKPNTFWQPQLPTHSLGAAPGAHIGTLKMNNHVNVNQTGALSRDLLHGSLGDMLNTTASHTTPLHTTPLHTTPLHMPQSHSPRETWTKFD